ncbi:inner membrane protein [compost metagenome]
MNGRTHLLSGLILGTALCTKFDLHGPMMASCAVGSLFPDTDHRKSLLGRVIPLWLIFRPHRQNVLHSLTGMLIVSSVWAVLTMSWIHAAMFAAGYLAHLCLDTLTKMGVPWLWPKRKLFSLRGIVQGVSELLILFAFYTIVVATISVL